jgi:crotonobetainyl-CoA:carnitine CoA-transferase CaiB-like acyl-CoA transferase
MAYHTFLSGPFKNAKPPDRRDLVFETKDGHMIASTVAHREFAGFCRAAGKTEWLDDPRFEDAAGLVKHAVARLELMAEALKTRTTDEWLEALDAEDVPCAPVLTRDQLAEHPQIQANELIVESDHAIVGRIREARPAERLDGTPSEIRRPAPALGEHTEEVLREIGLGDDALASLRAAGAVRDAG